MPARQSASSHLIRLGLSPAIVRERLASVEPDEIDCREAPFWFRVFFPARIAGIAFPSRVYLRRRTSRWTAKQQARLVMHELAHVEQWRRHGRIGFLRRYLMGYVRNRMAGMSHWTAYREIPLEREADYVAASLVARSTDVPAADQRTPETQRRVS